ncbi:formate/nitrite transporter family protein [Carnobacteriaceae bacterium zg-ZUI252]|nr:formate/nitrite transporter family protein [Carnobacteriaceae bacterium zg-ZUI252]MBS4770722.1 formate/nitrite transporter family protein [Carnobacteriaceae bacterium zg-ZUI240]
MNSQFLEKIEKACQKKQYLFDTHPLKYAIRCLFAGAFLTMSTAGGAIAADKIGHVHPDLSKFFFAFIFAFGLVYILFLNGELATSNMMYLSAGVFHKKINFSKAIKILLFCTLFNLIGAFLIASLFSASSTFQAIDAHGYLAQTVISKITKPTHLIVIEGILANIFVNVAIVSYLLVKDETAKIIIALSAVFIFVYLGQEHVIANFASFGLVAFHSIAHQIAAFQIGAIAIQWLLAFTGNCIGGSIIGVGYTFLNKDSEKYVD